MLSAEQERHLYAMYGEASGDGLQVEFNYNFSDDKIDAGSFFHAAHHGDAALQLVEDTLQQVANEYHLPVVHTGIPLTVLAEKVFRRNSGYQEIVIEGNVFFQKSFQPVSA